MVIVLLFQPQDSEQEVTIFKMKAFLVVALVLATCALAIPIPFHSQLSQELVGKLCGFSNLSCKSNIEEEVRQLESAGDTSLSQADLSGGMCFIMYTSGAEEKISCIQRTACEDPKTASEYATAAKMVYKVHKMVGLNFSPKYETVLNALEDAKSHSLRGGDYAVFYLSFREITGVST